MKKLYLKFKHFTLLLFILSASYQSWSQSEEVTLRGQLVDEATGDTLVGVPVFIKGTKTGTQTNEEGNFELKTNQAPPFTLVISYPGYQAKEIEVYDAEEPIDVKLRSEKSQNEVVVIGYGEQKRSDITGSVASVPTELKTQPVASVDRLLQGAVSGVQVTQTSGQPGAGTSVQIRGTGSLTAGTQPLYVIDGFPIYNDQSVTPNQTNGGVIQGANINPLSSINTSDIESIDVLKDASATAIYGSRGANGVVIVTTKKGSHNKSSINYDGYIGFQNPTRLIPLANSSDFIALREQAIINNGGQPLGANGISPSDGILGNRALLIKNGFDPDNFQNVNTNWEKAIIRNQAPMQNHNLSVFTGTEKTRIVLAGNYFNQEGVLYNTGFSRYSGRLNVEHDYSKRLKISSYILASNTNTNVAPPGVVTAALYNPPILSIYNADGTYKRNSPFELGYGNPLNSLKNNTQNTKTNNFLGNIGVEYKILEGLSAKVLVGANVTDNKQNMYLPSTVQEGAGYSGLAQVGSFFTTNWLNENTVSYNKKIGNTHSIGAVIGYTQQESVTNSAIAGSSGFPSDGTQYNALQNGTQQSVVVSGYASSPASNQSKWVLESYLARVNYGYKDKYLLTLTTRSDGSSKFSSGHKWGTFPSAALAWNASNEDFVKQFKSISLLKFRFSAGITGNQQIPPYQSLSQMTYERYNFGNTTVAGFAPTNIYNSNLTWEKTTQYNFGIDLGLFKNRITLTADVYLKKTRDLLLNLTLPSQTGVLNYTSTILQDQAYENAGSMQNKGFELAILTQNIQGKKFKWNTSLVYSENRNEVTSLASGLNQLVPNTALPSVAAVGYSAGSFLVYQTDGLVQPGTSLKDAQKVTINAPADPNNKNLALAGQQKYKDIDGNGKITANDRIVINNQPKFIAGLTNTFSHASNFGTFDLTIFFQTVYGNKIFNQNASVLGVGTGYQNVSGNYLEYYKADRTNTDIAAPFPNPAPTTSSSRYIEDGSYLRLKNLTLGYSLPTQLLDKARIKSIRLYVSAQNIWTWTHYTGFDPEVSSNDQSGINIGVDTGSYPNIKTVLGGLQLSF